MTAGLGKKPLVFIEDADSEEVHVELLYAYSKLHMAGGYGLFCFPVQGLVANCRYKILRTSETNTHKLEVIPSPPSGYIEAYLKSVTGQAKVYVRPLQSNLDLSPAAAEETVGVFYVPLLHYEYKCIFL